MNPELDKIVEKWLATTPLAMMLTPEKRIESACLEYATLKASQIANNSICVHHNDDERALVRHEHCLVCLANKLALETKRADEAEAITSFAMDKDYYEKYQRFCAELEVTKIERNTLQLRVAELSAKATLWDDLITLITLIITDGHAQCKQNPHNVLLQLKSKLSELEKENETFKNVLW